MVVVKSYKLPPTPLIPNSPYPLLHYSQCLSDGSDCDATDAYDLMSSNGWQVQWIFRYGSTQQSHYHSQAHECMVVLSGHATIRFGVADTSKDMDQNTHGPDKEDGGIEVEAHAGDMFIVPAGVAHKTFDTTPAASFKLLTPGDGHHINADDKRTALAEVSLSGFTMIGSYPTGSVWDSKVGGEHKGNYDVVWAVPKPDLDPFFGQKSEGLQGLW